jgi:hypothetical protein
MLATCEGWKPMRLACEVMPFVWYGSDGTKQDSAHCVQGDAVPNFTDPATLGALLGLVREKWGFDVYLRPHLDSSIRWVLCSVGLDVPVNPYITRRTKGATLLAALEAAHGPAPRPR